jgi:hypothetical protein
MNYGERWPDNKPGRASGLREGRFLLSSPAWQDFFFSNGKRKKKKRKQFLLFG